MERKSLTVRQRFKERAIERERWPVKEAEIYKERDGTGVKERLRKRRIETV